MFTLELCRSREENISKRKDSRTMFIYQNNNQFKKLFQIDKMNFTMYNLSKSLQTIASYLFRPGEPYKTHNIDALLLYSMKLDEYLITSFQDYQTDILAEILVDMLIDIDFKTLNQVYKMIQMVPDTKSQTSWG